MSPIAQADLLCTNCAGQCVYQPETGALTCQNCATGHEILIDPVADPTVEQHYDPDLPHTEQPEFTQDRAYKCQTCGGEVVFQGHSISEKLPVLQRCFGRASEQRKLCDRRHDSLFGGRGAGLAQRAGMG